MPAAAHPPTDSALDHALALVELGLRPVPIKPGGKHPTSLVCKYLASRMGTKEPGTASTAPAPARHAGGVRHG